ncbi:MAG TPA: tetratricopeptide repeat protein, partial [Thermoanaerobaculia bacterium]|nr:tetratricopeptide repeat protein [Thermoanaerobaculia bacterium]
EPLLEVTEPEPELELTPEPEPEPILELAPEPEPLPVEELSTQELTFGDELPVAEEFAAVEELSFADETGPSTLFEPEPVESLSAAPDTEIAAEPLMEVDEPLLDLGQPELELAQPDLEIDEPMPALDEPAAAEPAFDDPLLTDPMFGGQLADEPMFGGPIADTPLLDEQLADEPLLELDSEPAIAFGSAAEPEPVAAPAFDEPAADPFFGTEAGGFELEDLPLEELGEVDFYIEQELFDEARRKLDALSTRFPGNAELESRRERLEDAATAAAAAAVVTAAPPAAARPSLLSRDEIENELLSAIPDDDDDFALPMAPSAPVPAAAVAQPPAPAMTASLVQEENLFADEDNFFDLAAELESELADEDESISLSEEEQSLEEIFKEFKKGVEQQLDSEDYDTHYNLGIAYKEMGLIDEAIGEFQLASKDPKRAVECASMLGLCFLEKGMPQLAIKWYRKGLEMPEITEDEHVGLLYDLASAYQEVGDTENAQKAFMEVYGMNSNYRDIVSRIKQLEDAKR